MLDGTGRFAARFASKQPVMKDSRNRFASRLRSPAATRHAARFGGAPSPASLRNHGLILRGTQQLARLMKPTLAQVRHLRFPLAATWVAIMLAPGSGMAAGLSVTSVVADNGLPAHSVQWTDAAGQSRTAIMVDQRPQGAGYLRQLTYQVNGASRVCRGTGDNGHQGDGYVQNHTAFGGDNSSHTTPGTTTVVLNGSHHAIISYDMPNYTIDGKTVPTTVQWFFAEGRSNPIFALSQDARATAGNLGADSRSPYGDMAYDGGMGATVGGASFGDTYKFVTLAAAPEQVTRASGWRYNEPNTIPYAMQWADPAQVDAEMGHVATVPIAVQDQGSDPRTDPLVEVRGMQQPNGPMIDDENWAYQILNYVLPAAGPTGSKRLTWGTQWGLPGGFNNYGDASLSVRQYSQHASDPLGQVRKGTRADGMLMAYSVFVVFGSHSGGYLDGTVGQTVKQMENAAAASLTAATGTVKTSGPVGVGNAAAATITYTPAGYNPIYSTWEITAAGNAADATLTPAAGQALDHPVFVVNGYTLAQLPASISVGAGLATPDLDYFLTLDTASQRLWITVNRIVSSPVNLKVTPAGGGAPAPLINAIPASGAVATSVQITGANFSGATAVTFNGTSATFTVDSPSQITAKVPAGATAGPIAVTTPGGTATSATNFTPAPALGGLPIYTDQLLNGFEDWSWAAVDLANPVPVHSGVHSIKVTAGAFQALYIHFTTPVSFASYAGLTFWIHGGDGGGQPLLVQATVDGNAQTAVDIGTAVANTWQQHTLSFTDLGLAGMANFNGFWIQSTSGQALSPFYVDDIELSAGAQLPTITAFPASGVVGSSIQITGANFTGATAVTFNGVNATFTVDSATQITAVVPAGATAGPIGVMTPAGPATSATNFTPLPAVQPPTITAFPASGAVGSSIQITGANFTGATAVTFNGVNATFTVDSATQITAVVPAGATAGPIGVMTPAGPATSATNFTPLAVPPERTHLSVNADQVIQPVDARWFGVNTAFWDNNLYDPATVSLLEEMGCLLLRFPGGSEADTYHWQAHQAATDGFAAAAASAGAQAVVTVNYGSGTPTEAADWVRHYNVDNHYGFKYWEIGNENYGVGWEHDESARPHDPFTYAQRAKDYITQMKAVDPSIKVGVVVITGEDSPGDLPYNDHPVTNPLTGKTHTGWTPVLLHTLKDLGMTPDFVVYHRYPEWTDANAPQTSNDNDATLLQGSAGASGWPGVAADLRGQIAAYFGPGGEAIELYCTENNSDAGAQGKQSTSLVNGLYYADSLSQLMLTEFKSFMWWDLRNSSDASGSFDPNLYGWRNYGDFGLINGLSTRHPTFYAAKLMRSFVSPGDSILRASSENSLLAAYAASRPDGTLSLLVINKDLSNNSIEAQIALNGFTPQATATVHSYGIPQDNAARDNAPAAAQDIATAAINGAAANFNYTFPPLSLTVLTFSPVSVAVPAPTLTLRAAPSQTALRIVSGPQQYDRQNIATDTTANDYGWVGGGAMPVTYSLTIASFPGPAYAGLQAHVFLVPNSTGATAPDYVEPSVLMLDIQGHADGTASAWFRYKINTPNDNAFLYGAGTLGQLDCSAGPLGTWSMSFLNDTDITLTAPNGATKALSFPDAAAVRNAFGGRVTAYFGNQANDPAQIGQATTFSRIEITNAPRAQPIQEAFPGPDLNQHPTNVSWQWVKLAASPAGISVVVTEGGLALSWSLPDDGFSLQFSPSLSTPGWIDPGLQNIVSQGTSKTVFIPRSALPNAASGFFRLVKRQ